MRLAVFLLAVSAYAQTLAVYSEFRRIDAKGEIITADKGGKPREILSPGFARNAWHTFRIVLQPEKNAWYTMHISQNPDDFLTPKIYREMPGGQLQPAKLPLQGKSATGASETYLLDVWVARDAKVKRIRLEAQLTDGKGWFIYPMEVRILNAQVPDLKPVTAAIAQAQDSAESPAREVLREYLCGAPSKLIMGALSAQSLVRRNAQQDIALARQLEGLQTREQVTAGIREAAGLPESFCSDPRVQSPAGPEWYLKVRDYLYRESSRKASP